jgi:hypothetical protein
MKRVKLNEKIIAADLLKLLRNNTPIHQISSWAEGVYALYCREFDPETEEIINRVAFMAAGPEFFLTKEELESFAPRLMCKWDRKEEK